MPFDGITTACIVGELTSPLMGAKIEKVYQPAPEEIILHLHGERKKFKLLISAGSSHARIHMIEGATANPPNPPGFCMLLRKHLQNGRIRDFYQKETERIVEIAVDSLDEMGFAVHKKLVIEIMGKHSNISLVDIDTGKILDSIKRITGDINRYRQLLPGIAYIYPPSQGKVSFWDIDKPDTLKDTADAKITDSLVARFQGISPFFAKALCKQANINSTLAVNLLSDADAARLFAAFAAVRDRIKSGACENIVYLNEKDRLPVDFYPLDLSGVAPDDSLLPGNLGNTGSITVKWFDSLSTALEYYYENKASSSHIRQKSADLLKVVTTALDKLYLKHKRLTDDLAEASGYDDIRLKGELLTANIYKIHQGNTAIEVDNYYDGSRANIPLDPLLSPSENVQKYFKKYNKAKTAVKEKNIQLTETKADIDYLETILTFIENAEDFSEITDLRQELIEGRYLRKRKTNQKTEKSGLKPIAFTASDGFRLAVGRNNKQNDILTLKTAGNKDIWFHTKDIPGSHVILFTEGKEPTESAIKEAAALAAYHSKGRQSDNVPVDYTIVKNVRKPTGAKPGMVIYDHYNTLYVHPAAPDSPAD